jgi:DNA-binding NarL/FixJ family response regulator
MQHVRSMQASTLKYVTLFLTGSVVFFAFDVASDIYERVIASNAPSLLDLTHLFFEVFSAGALIVAIRILVRQLRWLQVRNARQSESLSFLRGEMDSFVHGKFDEWSLTSAERDIAMYMLKGLSIAEIAAARSTAEGTVKAQSSNIFRKTGVASRMELMSHFMDEFLDVGAEVTDTQRQVGLPLI